MISTSSIIVITLVSVSAVAADVTVPSLTYPATECSRQDDSKFSNADWQRGIGGGVYFGAGPLLMDLAAAWAEDGSARVNFGLGVSF